MIASRLSASRVCLLLAVATSFGLTVDVNHCAPGEAASSNPSLAITLRAPAEVALGSPFLVTVEFQNKKDSPIIVFSRWYDPNHNNLEIRDSKGRLLKCARREERALPLKEEFVTIAEGKKHTFSKDIEPEAYPSLRSGEYSMRLRYQNVYRTFYDNAGKERGNLSAWTGCLYSNTVKFSVVESKR
jgi:hypothetical protein